jgi:hypothetical protein
MPGDSPASATPQAPHDHRGASSRDPPTGQGVERRFSNGEEFRKCLQAFESALVGERWQGRRGPIILPYGWPDTPAD